MDALIAVFFPQLTLVGLFILFPVVATAWAWWMTRYND